MTISREDVADIFVESFNELCPLAVAASEPLDFVDPAEPNTRSLEHSDITVTYKRKDGAVSHLLTTDSQVRIGVIWDKWDDMSDAYRLVLVTHHLAHCTHSGYTPQFWIMTMNVWRKLLDERSFDIDWERAKNRMHAIYGANTPESHRDELRRMLEEITDYEYAWYVTLDHNQKQPIVHWNEDHVSVAPSKVDAPSVSDGALFAEYQSLEQTDYVFYPPKIEAHATMDGIEIVSNAVTAALLLRLDVDTFPVAIVA